MTLNDDEQQQLCTSLIDVMNDINGLLKGAGEELSRYKGIQKIKNIAKSCDPSGIEKIPKYLDGIAVVLSDHKAFNNTIGRKLDQADSIATKLNRLQNDFRFET